MSERDYLISKALRAGDEIDKALNPIKALKQAKETRQGVRVANAYQAQQRAGRLVAADAHRAKYTVDPAKVKAARQLEADKVGALHQRMNRNAALNAARQAKLTPAPSKTYSGHVGNMGVHGRESAGLPISHGRYYGAHD